MQTLSWYQTLPIFSIPPSLPSLKFIFPPFFWRVFLCKFLTLHVSSQSCLLLPYMSPSKIHGPSLPSQSSITQLMQSLNHTQSIKLDKTNYVIWKTQMENVIHANGFEDHASGVSSRLSPTTTDGSSNPDFVLWRLFDRLILTWIYSSLTPEIMGQIVGYHTISDEWAALCHFPCSCNAVVAPALDNQERIAFYAWLYHETKTTIISPPLQSRCLISTSFPLLTYLGVDYSPIVTSPTTRDDDLSLHTVHSVLLT